MQRPVQVHIIGVQVHIIGVQGDSFRCNKLGYKTEYGSEYQCSAGWHKPVVCDLAPYAGAAMHPNEAVLQWQPLTTCDGALG